MPLVDSHCHIDFDPLYPRIDEVLTNARDNDVGYLLCVSVNLEDFPRVLSLAEQHDHIFASVGVHPNEQEGREPTADELVELARHPRVVAIGETGLDYFRSTGVLDWQHERFRRHIDAARQCGKPLIVHSRDAPEDTVRLMSRENAGEAAGVMHCFTEDWHMAKQALDLGFYISFSGIVTFKNAKSIQEVARKAPLDRILVETDSPYLTPVPFRGKTNEPAYVKHTAEYVAKLRGLSYEAVAEATSGNFFTLFPHAGH
ncbi:MAG: putative metal-dependent hydrolase YcfH [Gammaproteobacteria bacterium]|nr:putative metal-dependent hydrolase YcfH [Gammaproteobacteria bacterium]